MSKYTFGKVFELHEAQAYWMVMWDTFGHLAPEPHKKYKGWMLVVFTEMGDSLIYDWDFEELNGSPWQADDFDKFIGGFSELHDHKVPPGIYKYEGWYKKFKNGSCQFASREWVRQSILPHEETQ